jgi:hypothetical protein
MIEAVSNRRGAVLVLAALVFAGCAPRRDGAKSQSDKLADAYRPPPMLVSAARAPDGSVRLSGSAPPDALVRLRSPEGPGVAALAGEDGAWSLTLPPAEAPRLFAFDAELSGQVLRGEGAVAVLPAPSPVALILRAGFAAAPTGSGPQGRLQLLTVDYDGGGAAAGGFAPPNSPVRLTVDGGVVGVARADAHGHFAILAVDPQRGVAPGRRELRVDTPKGLSVERPVQIAASTLAADKAFAAEREPGGWRISWRIPGGGVQSSLVFDDALSGATKGGAAR